MRSRSTLFCGNFSAKNEQFLLLSKPRKPLAETLPNIYKKDANIRGAVTPLSYLPHIPQLLWPSQPCSSVCVSVPAGCRDPLFSHVCRHQDPNQHHTWRPSPSPVSKTAAKWVQLGVVQNFFIQKSSQCFNIISVYNSQPCQATISPGF